ncbi:MAG TPA: cytochrome c [Terriglobales bacterium]|nr:cytochrome c [Terriglobales bacterium]
MKLQILLLLGVSMVPAFAGPTEGKEVFDKSCKACHGAQGQGNPGMAKMMKVEMRALGSKEVQAQSDADLKKIITQGKGKMKPVASLSAKQVDDVVAFVRTLK